ncbi:WRKY TRANSCRIPTION FACTOR 30-RELATED-RELATED, partial [Salix purpurea]
MAEDQDWDLYAVVRSCTSAAAAATTNKNSSSSSENFESPFDQRLASLTFDGGGDEESSPFSFPNLACQPRNNNCLQELRDSCRPFLPGFTTSAGRLQGKNTNNNIPIFSISDSGVIFSGQNQAQLAQQQRPSPSTGVAISPWFNSSHKQPPHVQEQQNQRRQLHQQGTSTSSLFPLRTTQSQAPRKKKSNQKRLISHVTAEILANDVWAWR